MSLSLYNVKSYKELNRNIKLIVCSMCFLCRWCFNSCIDYLLDSEVWQCNDLPVPGTWPWTPEPELPMAGDRYLQRRGFKSGPGTTQHSRFHHITVQRRGNGQREERLATWDCRSFENTAELSATTKKLRGHNFGENIVLKDSKTVLWKYYFSVEV